MIFKLLAAGVTAAALLPASALAAKSSTPTTAATPAASSCVAPPTWKAFAAFGDTADYFVAPGGDFELPSHGWTLTNARIADENDKSGVLSGKRSLLLGTSTTADAEAISPEFCVSADNPAFRFLSRTIGAGKTGKLETEIIFRSAARADQLRTERSTKSVLSSQTWAPSEIQPLATALKSKDLGAGVLVRLRFVVDKKVAAGGGLLVDNVLIDPFRRA